MRATEVDLMAVLEQLVGENNSKYAPLKRLLEQSDHNVYNEIAFVLCCSNELTPLLLFARMARVFRGVDEIVSGQVLHLFQNFLFFLNVNDLIKRE